MDTFRSKNRLSLLLIATVIAVIVFSTGHVYGLSVRPFDGNYTDVGKPGFPQRIELDQISPGESWTYNYTLIKDIRYHVYLIGEWSDLNEHQTDYDILLYRQTSNDPRFVSSHTESAGYPEQVSNDGKGQFFIPTISGEYYFVVVNDADDSAAAEPATLVVVERIDTDNWYTKYLHEPYENITSYNDNWVYEFISDKPRIKVDIRVPPTLDMYEARLYLMANVEKQIGFSIDGAIVPWEPGLYAQLNGTYGGFNKDPQGYRHLNASVGCERTGDDMVFDFIAPNDKLTLYHLILLPEYGNGTVSFRLQTDFTNPAASIIDPPKEVESGEEVIVKCMILDESKLDEVKLYYSTDGEKTWKNSAIIEENQYYIGTLPGQTGGTEVSYYYEITDILANTVTTASKYLVRTPSELYFTIDNDGVYGGNELFVAGELNQPNKQVTLTYRQGENIVAFNVKSDSSGKFTHAFAPNKLGSWEVSASYTGDESWKPVSSENEAFNVKRKPTSLSLNLSSSKIHITEQVNITGQFSENNIGTEIFITASNGFNETFLLGLTDNTGFYRTSFEPDTQGVWRIQAQTKPNGIFTEGSLSNPVELEVGNPTLEMKLKNVTSTAMKPPYVYGVGALSGGTIGGALYLARKKGLFRRSGEVEEVEEAPEEEDEDDFDIDF